ncbi:hypothetical protein DL98DRAFT_552741 [Cadophora sp. DSE1049]|nr:hypothetical protein DL98DRAFT_552741 [Cadophora sp. DSE1049]
MLALSQSPLPRIRSWTIDEQGVLMLTNRPLAHHFHFLENEGIPTNILRNLTYMTTDAYYTDLLKYHDSRIRNQPNSIINEQDGFSQIANLFTIRRLLPYFTTRDLRHGPFITNHGVDELKGEELQKFENVCEEFMDIFEEEEKSFPFVYGSAICRADIMRKGWKMGNFWYFYALKSPKRLYNLFVQHIQPIFKVQRDIKFAQIEVVAAKLEDKKKYKQQLR